MKPEQKKGGHKEMTEYKITYTSIWGDTKEHRTETEEDAREWILKRRYRDDIKQDSWKVEKE
jgi:hypothetical protein